MHSKRKSNFELMRIVSMFFIIVWHVIMHGNVINNCTNPILRNLLQMVMFVLVIHVNSFVLLTGYFQSNSKFKIKKCIKLILQILFYIIISLIICIQLKWIKNYNIVTIINFTTKSIKDYWFINSYLIMYAFSDYINIFINSLNKNTYKKFLITGFIILSIIPFLTSYIVLENSGYNFFNFIYLYILGAYLKKYPLKTNMNINKYRLALITIFFLLAATNFLLNKNAEQLVNIGGIFGLIGKKVLVTKLVYSHPIIILQAIIYFEFFKTLNIKNNFINLISQFTFGIYLFHDNFFIRTNIYKYLKIDNGTFNTHTIIIKIIIVSILLYIVGLIIEWIRNLIFKKLIK